MKEIAVIFDQSVMLPGNGDVAVETFGFIFPKSDLTKPENIRTYTKHYIFQKRQKGVLYGRRQMG